jgi:predicted CXXCH cytochrome family protein
MSRRKMKLLLSLSTVIIVLLFSHFGDHAYSKVKLKAKIPALCYDCHDGLKKNLEDPHVHFLFKQGKCITCHNTHVSSVDGLLHGETNSVCLKCHEALRNRINKGIVHNVIRRGSCTDCHQAHSSRYDKLLTKQEKTLCWECHEDVKEKENLPFACDTFKKGLCSACHDSHASLEDNLLRSKPNSLCKTCHAPKCKAGDVSIASITKNLDCTSCHSGHGSDSKGVLGPFGHSAFLDKNCVECHDPIQANKQITMKKEGELLCLDCHKKSDATYSYKKDNVHVQDVKNPCVICHNYHASDEKNLTKSEPVVCLGCHTKIEKRTLAMEKKLKTKECAPIRNRQCFECHIPMHSDRPLNYRDEPIAMCSRCHKAEHSTTHPVGNDVIDPRNNQIVTCISCHSMHSARSDFMLTHDRNRALCIQCHKR